MSFIGDISLVITGLPAQNPSITGNPNPSYKDGNKIISAF
jgi:hypothetical protein